MNRKSLSLILVIVMISMMLVSAAAEQKPYEGVTLSFWGGQAEYNEGTKAVFAAAEEALGLKVQIEVNPGAARVTTSSRLVLRQTTCRTSLSIIRVRSCTI